MATEQNVKITIVPNGRTRTAKVAVPIYSVMDELAIKEIAGLIAEHGAEEILSRLKK